MRKLVAVLVILGNIIALPWHVTVYAQAGPDQAEIIFHRPNKVKWKATRFNIEQDGRPIGQLRAGTEIAVSLDPGTYTFTTTATSLDGVDYLTLSVEAGKTYRVKGEVLASWPVGRPKFTDVVESGVATAVAGPAAGTELAIERGTSQAASSDSDATTNSLKSLVGDWDLAAWSHATDGHKIYGKGTVTGSLVGDYSVRLVVNDFYAAEIPDAIGGGSLLITQHPEKGLLFESDFPAADRKLQMVGRNEAGKYVFYLFGSDGLTMTGVQRASLYVEFQSIDQDTWVADTYSSVEGKKSKVQSTQLTRR